VRKFSTLISFWFLCLLVLFSFWLSFDIDGWVLSGVKFLNFRLVSFCEDRSRFRLPPPCSWFCHSFVVYGSATCVRTRWCVFVLCLMMGATPSSAVQQTAYLEALDEFFDYDEHSNLRKCLVDEQGNRLRDSEGHLKTLRHRFAVYCDDVAAGANTLEELYEPFEALICCCHKAGIQIKAAKVKFGVRKVTFHNYTISSEGVEPKEATLCRIRNFKEPKDISQVRAFLGCCQQLKHYIKDYGDNSQTIAQYHKERSQRLSTLGQGN
jgi:hypothetical protein